MKLSDTEKQALKNRAMALIRSGVGQYAADPYQVNVSHNNVTIILDGQKLACIVPKGKSSEFNATFITCENAMIGARKHA